MSRPIAEGIEFETLVEVQDLGVVRMQFGFAKRIHDGGLG
jgi:hypothetical protein